VAFFSVLLALVALGLSGFLASKHIVAPIDAQLAFLEQVARGNLDAHIDMRTGDERDRLVSGMNQMADELKTSLVSIDELNAALVKLEQAHQELRETQAKLVQTGKLAALGELSAGLAHELNQPLTAIRGFGQLMEEDLAEGRMPTTKAIERILKASARMSAVVKNVRTFAGGARQTLDRVPAYGPARDAVSLVSEQLRQHGVMLVVEVEPGLPDVIADRAQIQQVLLNLLGNARDALDSVTESGGRRIEVRVYERDGHVCYSVQDNGPGVPESLRDKLFEPFFTTKAPGSGMGLGLSLSHGIVGEQNGSIEHEEPEEGGARFVVRLPAASTAMLRAADEAAKAAEEKRSTSRPALDTPSGRVLLVENEEDVREILRRICLRAGHHVDEAEDGDTALRCLESRRYDVVLTDLHLPGASGLAVLRAVLKRGRGARVVLMSTSADDSDWSEGSIDGAFALLRKPFEDLSEVSVLIDRAMGEG
jgi:signal transduction histidine kinase/CheY-like chemotaxis protein